MYLQRWFIVKQGWERERGVGEPWVKKVRILRRSICTSQFCRRGLLLLSNIVVGKGKGLAWSDHNPSPFSHARVVVVSSKSTPMNLSPTSLKTHPAPQNLQALTTTNPIVKYFETPHMGPHPTRKACHHRSHHVRHNATRLLVTVPSLTSVLLRCSFSTRKNPHMVLRRNSHNMTLVVITTGSVEL